MKVLAPAIIAVAVLSACGGNEPSTAEAKPVSPNPAMEGLWVSVEIYDTNNTAARYSIPSDELLYFNFSGANDNPVKAEAYARSETENCYHYDSDSLTHIGNNLYRDQSNEAGKITTNNQNLVIHIEVDGLNMAVVFNKAAGLSQLDIPICESNLLQNDDPMDSIFNPLISILK